MSACFSEASHNPIFLLKFATFKGQMNNLMLMEKCNWKCKWKIIIPIKYCTMQEHRYTLTLPIYY